MRARTIWFIVGGFLLFLVVFQAVESLVGPSPAESPGAADAPLSAPEPIRLEVTRADELTVQIDVGSQRKRIGVDDGHPEEADTLFACITEGIADLDPELTGQAPAGWLQRRDLEKRLNEQLDRITDRCLMALPPAPPRDSAGHGSEGTGGDAPPGVS